MQEFKTAEDLESKALYLLKVIAESRIKIDVEGNKRLKFNYDKTDVKWLAAELLEMYTEGYNDRCALNLG